MSNGPSNIRINPFVGSGGATTYVNLTETHIIPSVSPFVIRLNEVPEKRDPSNMKCVYVDDTTGAVTSRALTEVAATPAAGQFRPDYSTKADKDDSWNTGLIEFNSADAGKIVQVSYTGMGTLAAVQSNKYPSWYTDRGDGSDGDFIPSENTTIGGTKNYKRVFIKEGVTVTVDKYVIIKCQDSFVNLGTITADGQGAAGGSQNSTSVGMPGENGSLFGGAGGAGGGSGASKPGGAGGSAVKNFNEILLNDVNLGCGGGGGQGLGGRRSSDDKEYGGGPGGAGGGTIGIISNSFDNRGVITANGQNGKARDYFSHYASGGGGGGGGGGITIIAQNIEHKGEMESLGGKGGVGSSGNINYGADGQPGTITFKQLGVL